MMPSANPGYNVAMTTHMHYLSLTKDYRWLGLEQLSPECYDLPQDTGVGVGEAN